MNDFTTEILKTLANKGDLNELFRVHLEKAVNTLLKTELTAFLNYDMNQTGSIDSKNTAKDSNLGSKIDIKAQLIQRYDFYKLYLFFITINSSIL